MSLEPTKSPPESEPSAILRAWSITLQLVFFFTIGAAGLVLLAMLASYWVVIQHVNNDNDRYLSDKLAALRADMAADSGPQSLSQELAIIHVADKIYAVRVIDSAGKIVAESPKMPRVLPVEIFPKTLSFSGQRPATVIYHAANHKTFALVTAKANVGSQSLTVQLAQERTHDERFTARYAALLTGMLGCGILTCAGVAMLVTRRTLRPLRRLRDSIERIGATRLEERVPMGSWPGELQPLALGFNNMLGRLEDSFTRLSQFSADLAHELRTPISILRGEAEGALTKPQTLEQYREVIASSLEEMQRLSTMIDNLLFLARAETIGSIKRQFFDGHAALKEICEFYEVLSQEQDVELSCEGRGPVYAEPGLFRRALINLITNALRFTPAGGRVTVSLQHRDGTSEIAVADTGCGISPQHVPNVFNRFFRGDAPRSSHGSGLGLSIVKSIMQTHDGNVSVQSEVGRGTVVTLSFPNAKPI